MSDIILMSAVQATVSFYSATSNSNIPEKPKPLKFKVVKVIQ